MKIIIFIYKQIPDSTVFLKPIDTNYKIKVRSYRTVNFLSSMNVLHIYPSCNVSNYTKEYKTIMCLHDLFAQLEQNLNSDVNSLAATTKDTLNLPKKILYKHNDNTCPR